VTSDQTIHQTAQDLGVNPGTLYGWVKMYQPNSKYCNTESVSNNPDAELKQLKKELARVKQERDILKKAVAYFASDVA
jgi:transposase-like protein